ncbi:unnamed protein product [Brassicogethes aeneus]|uniref:PHD finger protein 21A n=1 Tax=Brassicogethes aeneus TaxID=1431903 RepID=A0A9P0FL63_BRAAE|nr:unnamed protein product [Brassicogethes aeneus]
MKDLEISKALKTDIETNQNQLKNAICNHQIIVKKLKDDPENVDVQKELNKAEENIVFIGLEQKTLLERLREEYKTHQKSLKTSVVKNGIEERRNNLSNALNRARKQNITITRSASATSVSDDSNDHFTIDLSPEKVLPLNPQDVTQAEFLNYFMLSTHEVYKEMQNKRAERKRRSTANPHFLYGSRGWDFLSNNKRKRNAYLVSAVSPPHTRQSSKKRNEKTSPPSSSAKQNNAREKEKQQQLPLPLPPHLAPKPEPEPVPDGDAEAKPVFAPFPAIPNLPSGLIIERVSPSSSSPEYKTCVKCKQPGALKVCEVCSCSFHVSCHNRPLTQAPRQCPKCIDSGALVGLKSETRTVGSLNVPSGMTVSCISPSEVTEKVDLRNELVAKNDSLNAELTLLQDKHSQLTISLKSQKSHQEELLTNQKTTEEKIQQIFSFINAIKKPAEPAKPTVPAEKNE